MAQGRVTILDDDRAPQVCVPGEHTLCLRGGRFAVEAEWRTPQGAIGDCQAVELTDDSGYCWFFDADNVELIVLEVMS